MHAGEKKIGDIFNQDRILRIPFFQRSYVWGEDQWQRFLDDLAYISTDAKSYFFGSLILKQEETETSQGVGDVRTVIDGQQRLTTLIIFFKALSLLKGEPRIFDKFKLDDHQVALSHNHNDEKSFNKIVNLTENTKHIDDDASSDKIIGAYKFFMENIDIEKIDERRIRQCAIFVGIDLSRDDDEQQIFDTLNSLGVRLTTAELLKNHFFQRDDLDLYIKHWRDVFEKDGEIKEYWDKEIYAGQVWRTFIDLFFYAYLQIKVQSESDRITPKDREEFSRLENVFSSYKKLMRDYGLDKRNILKEIKKHANVFRAHFEDDVVKAGLEKSPSMQRINALIFGLETTTLIPYVLFVINNTRDDANQKKLFRAIESFIMRRLAVRASNRGYNLLFLRMINEQILSQEDFYKFVDGLSDTGNFMPNDAQLTEGFGHSKLVNKTALGILYFIESHGRDEKHATSLLGMKHYSLEHLMPKNWGKNWGKLDEQQTHIRNQKLLTLGNLAMITQKLNASIKDSEWNIKVNGRDKYGGLKQYASGIDIHSDFLGETEWNEVKIETRANNLLKKAKEIWPTE